MLLEQTNDRRNDKVDDNNSRKEADDRGESNVKISLGERDGVTEQGVNSLHRAFVSLKQ